MKDNKSKTVYIGGSTSIGSLCSDVTEWLDFFIEENLNFIIGDCPGTELALQNYLYSREYRDVSIYRCENERRFNIGDWKEKTICTSEDASQSRDLMLSNCDSAFIILDGESDETKGLITDLRRHGIPVFIYRTDLGRIRVFRRKNRN